MNQPEMSIVSLALAGGVGLLGLLAGLVTRRVVLSRLARAAAQTSSPLDDITLAALQGPVVLWGLFIGLYAAATLIELPPAWSLIARTVLIVSVIISISWSLSHLASALVSAHGTTRTGSLPSVKLLSNLVRVTVLLLGTLVVLGTLGISITPMLTALGVGGLAVGLALQDTLANLFAGIHLLVSRQVRPGDFVRLASGQEGFIQDITWRYTTIRQLPNNLTVVPNSLLASAVMANFSLPDPEQAVLVQVGVGYDSDLGTVERVTIEVGQEVMREVSGGVPDFVPFIRYHTFGDSSIQFTVILRGQEYVSQHLIKHEFIKRLHQRYRAEGIEIPFPIRTVLLRTPEPTAPVG